MSQGGSYACAHKWPPSGPLHSIILLAQACLRTPHCLRTWLYTSAPNHWGHLPIPKTLCPPHSTHIQNLRLPNTTLHWSALQSWIAPRGTNNPLLYVSTITHGQLLGTWSLKPTQIHSQHRCLRDSSQWIPFFSAFLFVLP